MPIIDQKKDIFGKIAALRTSVEGFPDLSLGSSLPSINNSTNSLDFLMDLLKSLIGFEKLRSMLSEILTYELETIEAEIKKELKLSLKELVSCGVDPSIPTFFKHQTVFPSASGYDIDLVKLDYLGMLFISPSSPEGKLLYDDALGTASKDFNSFLYSAVQSGAQEDWGKQTLSDDIISVDFDQTGGPTNNNLNLRASAFYSNPANGKTLTDLNNDYIDSINLLSPQRVVNGIIDSIFGSISVSVGKSQAQLEMEAKIDNIIDCIISADDTTVVDNSFFEFDNETIQDIESEAAQRKNGIRILKTCGNLASTMPQSVIETSNDNITSATTTGNLVEVKTTIDNSIQDMAAATSEVEPDPKNKYTIQLNLIDMMIKKLTMAIITIILSPKVLTIFLVNHRFVYGPSATFDGPIDFLKQNKTLVRAMVKAVRNSIIKVMLREVLKEIRNLAAKNAIKVATEKAKAQVAQIASLVGVPQALLRAIQGL
jgi:hypothetical protein